MKVTVVSESAFSVKGHGVHTAYVEMVHALKKCDGIEVTTNSLGSADIRHIHTVGLFGLLQLLLPGKKVISAHVVPDSFVGSLVGTNVWLPLATWYLRWFYNKADMVVAVSDTTREHLNALGVTKPVTVLHNMIDASRYKDVRISKSEARKKYGLPSHGVIVIGAGQVQPRKRVDSFVAAAVALPDVTFVWVGGMPFKKASAGAADMQRLIDTAPKNVIFAGIVPLDSMPEYYRAADIFFLPSEQETFGLVVIEAAAAGLPVVLRDIPDYAETFSKYAVMAEEGSFTHSIKRLASDTAYYSKYKKSSEQLAAKYDSDIAITGLINIYKKLLKP